MPPGPFPPRNNAIFVWMMVLATLIAIIGTITLVKSHPCQRTPPPLQPYEDPYDQITTVALGSSGLSAVTQALPEGAYKSCYAFPPFPAQKWITAKLKIHPALLPLLQNPGARRETLLVTFVDTVHATPFPRVNHDIPLTEPSNLAALAGIDTLIQKIRSRRAGAYDLDSLDLVVNFNAHLIEKYWIVQAWLLTLPLDQVLPLAARPRVLYIQPRRGGEQPPQCPAPGSTPCPTPAPADGNAANDVANGRCRIASDPYFDAGLGGSRIALLDAGVLRTHNAFTASTFGILRDAVAWPLSANPGITDCTPTEIADPFDHGTKSAAILIGGPWPSACFRGVTRATLDVFRVFDGSNSLVPDAAIKSMQCAVALGVPVIVAEMQSYGPSYAAIGDMADQAFDMGHRIIAAVGNDPGSTTTSLAPAVPADARKAIAVGARLVTSDLTIAGQRWGETADHRIKPEIQAPTNAQVASSAGPSAVSYYTGTSGSTPFAAGAASLMTQWLKNAGTNDPGATYVQLILGGKRSGPFPLPTPGLSAADQIGAGALTLPTDGTGVFGKIALDPCGCEVDIPIDVGAGFREIQAALWWPERAEVSNGALVDTHSDVNLKILDPNGVEQGTPSNGAPGVFERMVHAPPSGNLSSGTWKLRVSGKTLRRPPQKVYWAVALRH
ncbi:MAG TPA: S8/S53 family peptidase [Candidatus Eisenbacteria bacterium]|nr:S8/S53 family peptidase [Candidatus Eisenbacteria bacterium]